MQVSEVAGAFSGLAMGLNALATAILLPLLWQFFFETVPHAPPVPRRGGAWGQDNGGSKA
jgi:hypothetical protein